MKPETKEFMTAAEYQAYMKGRKPHVPSKGKKKASPQVKQMELLLSIEGVPFVKEYRFHPVRQWRFDFAITTKKIAIEYEGIYGGKGAKSRHTSLKGYTGDTEKYNEAEKLGWTVLRYTLTTYSKLIEDLKPLLIKKEKAHE